MRKTYQDPEFQKGLDVLGEQPRFGEPDFLKKAIKGGEVVALPILKEFGLYGEGNSSPGVDDVLDHEGRKTPCWTSPATHCVLTISFSRFMATSCAGSWV